MSFHELENFHELECTPLKKSLMESFGTIRNTEKPLTNVAKLYTLDNCRNSGEASAVNMGKEIFVNRKRGLYHNLHGL